MARARTSTISPVGEITGGHANCQSLNRVFVNFSEIESHNYYRERRVGRTLARWK